jgi:hypothetical protein
MDYTHIRLTGLNSITLAIQDAEYDDAFVLKGADGLGPAEVDVSISQGLEGSGYFQNKVPRNKQIVMRIGLQAAWSTVGGTPSDLRALLYGLLTGGYAGDQIAVILLDIDPDTLAETEVCRINGYVSKMETVPFSKDPQVQLTIECLSPYFVAPTSTILDLNPFDRNNVDILNTGNGPTGFYMSITFAGLAGGGIDHFEITTQGGLKKMRFEPIANIVNGNVLEINTNPGTRQATLATTNAMAWLTSDSDWIQLYGGVNTLSFSHPEYNWGGFNFKSKFWGV